MRRLRSIQRVDVPGYAFEDSSGDFSIYASDHLGRDGERWAPRPLRAYQLLESIGHMPTVESLFDVSQGVLTGLNGAFLVPKDYIDALPRTERKYFRPAVVNDSIDRCALRDSTYVFFPYGSELEIESEEALLKKLKNYARDRLLPNKAKLMKRAGADRDRWWQLTRPRLKLDQRGAKLISAYFGSSGSFTWDPDGSYIVVQGYGWTPKTGAIDEYALGYVAILNHPLVDTLLSAVSNNVSGGQWNLSERYVNGLPLPDLSKIPPELVDALRELGNALSRQLDIDEEAWTSAVYSAYGLSPPRG